MLSDAYLADLEHLYADTTTMNRQDRDLYLELLASTNKLLVAEIKRLRALLLAAVEDGAANQEDS